MSTEQVGGRDSGRSFIRDYAVEGGYESESGAFYEFALDFIHGEVFGFCCCGAPSTALAKIRDAMRLVKELHRDDYDAWNEHFKDWCERRDLVLGDTGTTYTFWYLLDSLGLTEHGGSVPGWLTHKGEDVLADLERLLADPHQGGDRE